MSDARLEDVAKLVERALRDSVVFERQPRDGQLLTRERTRLRRNQQVREYVALLAGAANADHSALGNNAARRTSLRDYPLRIRGGGEVDVRMVLRPTDPTTEGPSVMPFAPGDGVPWVEVDEFHLRLRDIPENSLGLHSLRVEFDPRGHETPIEPWLRDWRGRLDENPAHAAWHLHINSDAADDRRKAFVDDDLRLALSPPNPLTLVLSFAAWCQRVLMRPPRA